MEITGGQNGYFLQTNGAGVLDWAFGTTTGNGVVGGANRQIQYNNDGNFAGSVGFEFDSTTNIMTVPTVDANLVDANLVVANVIDANIGNIDTVNGNLVGNWSGTQWTTANLTSGNMPVPSMFMGSVFGESGRTVVLDPGSTFTVDGENIRGGTAQWNTPSSFNRFGDATSPYPGRMVSDIEHITRPIFIPVMTNAQTGNANSIIKVVDTGSGSTTTANITVNNIQGAGKNPVLNNNSGDSQPLIMLSTNSADTELFLSWATGLGGSNLTPNWTTVSTTAISSYSPIDCIGVEPSTPVSSYKTVALLSDTGAVKNSKTVNITTTYSGPGTISAVTIETGTIANIGANTNPKHQLAIQNSIGIAIPIEVAGQLGRIGRATIPQGSTSTGQWYEYLMPTITLNATESFAYCVLWLERTNEWLISAKDYDSVLAVGSTYTFRTSDGINFSTPVYSVNDPTNMTMSRAGIIEGIQNFGNTANAKQVRSYDNGETWIEINGSLPNWPAQCYSKSLGFGGSFISDQFDEVISITYTNAIPTSGYGMSANTASNFDNYTVGFFDGVLWTRSESTQNSSSNPATYYMLPPGVYTYLGGEILSRDGSSLDYYNNALFVRSSDTFPIPPG